MKVYIVVADTKNDHFQTISVTNYFICFNMIGILTIKCVETSTTIGYYNTYRYKIKLLENINQYILYCNKYRYFLPHNISSPSINQY